MPRHSKQYSASHVKRTSRQVNERMIGTHVERRPNVRSAPVNRRNTRYVETVARRARIRRFITVAVAVVIVLAVAIGAGFLAFRGTVGGELALKDSNASEALVAVRSDKPSFVLLTAELGSVAAPLDNGGPDVILLARLDAQNRTLALINVPPSLQITLDNRSDSVSSLANSGDAALIKAVSAFAKVDISHFVKIGEGGVAGIVNALGGVEVDVKQAIDDPHAGFLFIPQGKQVLNGDQAVTYLRATNIEFGKEDQLANQSRFATLVIEKLFSKEGNFATRLESVDSFFQTDYSLADIEGINSWLGGVSAGDITCANVPGYFTVATNVNGGSDDRYIASASDMTTLLDDLDNGRAPSVGSLDDVNLVSPSGFIVDVENGTTVTGAASSTSDLLKEKGFNIGSVGNAEQPVYEETLVIYKDGDEGLARAKTVIDALGVGRAVEKSAYYTFEHDILLIIGADNKPVS